MVTQIRLPEIWATILLGNYPSVTLTRLSSQPRSASLLSGWGWGNRWAGAGGTLEGHRHYSALSRCLRTL